MKRCPHKKSFTNAYRNLGTKRVRRYRYCRACGKTLRG